MGGPAELINDLHPIQRITGGNQHGGVPREGDGVTRHIGQHRRHRFDDLCDLGLGPRARRVDDHGVGLGQLVRQQGAAEQIARLCRDGFEPRRHAPPVIQRGGHGGVTLDGVYLCLIGQGQAERAAAGKQVNHMTRLTDSLAHGGDQRRLGAGADRGSLGARPEQEAERVHEQGLAGAGLAGEHVEAGAELELGGLDHREVLHLEPFQHPLQATRGGTNEPFILHLLVGSLKVEVRSLKKLAWIGLFAFALAGLGFAAKCENPAKTPPPGLPKGIGPYAEKTLKLDPCVDKALAKKGQQLFVQYCSACHKINKRYVGPPLKGVTLARSPEWIMNLFLNTQEMVMNDPIAKALLAQYYTVMRPSPDLKEEDFRAILEYLRHVDATGKEEVK